jgi:hypothetical protein
MLIYGSAYTYGTLIPYVTSFLYYSGDSEITTNKMSSLLLISILVLNFGMPLCNIKQLQFSNRVTTLLSISGVCLSIFAISFCDQFWHYLVIYGILFGLFIGFGYLAPIKNCYQHIPHLKGTAPQKKAYAAGSASSASASPPCCSTSSCSHSSTPTTNPRTNCPTDARSTRRTWPIMSPLP